MHQLYWRGVLSFNYFCLSYIIKLEIVTRFIAFKISAYACLWFNYAAGIIQWSSHCSVFTFGVLCALYLLAIKCLMVGGT